ncbi:MAG: NADH-quinone oxidoreductase subunit D [Planctomycetes bacterium]|nr:NADH-quinone oxidoreductase subunit D [Planctomycetota bacterium]
MAETVTPAPAVVTTVDAGRNAAGEKLMVLNMGPQHPAMHGTLRLVLELDGETVVRCRPEMGFLHTGFEKLGEYRSYNQFVTVTDRMNYLSAINNNIGWAQACEELWGVECTPRCRRLRVIMGELSRLSDHILCVGLQAMDLGAFSVMLWGFARREQLYDLFERVTGARLTNSWTRVGGLMQDVPADFVARVKAVTDTFPEIIDETDKMLSKNKIFTGRTRGVGVLSAEDAIAYGVTGPVLRASGVEYDLRRARPYSGYEKFDFDVPTQTDGDSFARFQQRLEEMRQSVRIIRQALVDIPGGPVNVDNYKLSLPAKELVYTRMEEMIHHFKLTMIGHGPYPPKGEVYSATEAPNGELGWYLVSDGKRNPYRVRVRPPSFYHFQVVPKLVEGRLISDLVAVLSSLNVIAGELDR